MKLLTEIRLVIMQSVYLSCLNSCKAMGGGDGGREDEGRDHPLPM